MGSIPITGSRGFWRMSGPDLLHVLAQLPSEKAAQGVQKLLLPSSELVVISLFVSIQNVIFY
jgi:hypothetical protein